MLERRVSQDAGGRFHRRCAGKQSRGKHHVRRRPREQTSREEHDVSSNPPGSAAGGRKDRTSTGRQNPQTPRSGSRIHIAFRHPRDDRRANTFVLKDGRRRAVWDVYSEDLGARADERASIDALMVESYGVGGRVVLGDGEEEGTEAGVGCMLT